MRSTGEPGQTGHGDAPPCRAAGLRCAPPLPDAPSRPGWPSRRHPSDAWRLWGPYLAGRQWGTVREDYSADGDAWGYFPFEQAEARAYRWGEDGLGGICDRFGFLNFSVALWNGQDSRLKERLFGLTNPRGQPRRGRQGVLVGGRRHARPTPTANGSTATRRRPFPTTELREQNRRRDRGQPEYELADTGVLAEDRFFDVTVSYAKAAPDDICIRITATNHGPDPAPLHLLPQLWFRNTWDWGRDDRKPAASARAARAQPRPAAGRSRPTTAYLGRYVLLAARRTPVAGLRQRDRRGPAVRHGRPTPRRSARTASAGGWCTATATR